MVESIALKARIQVKIRPRAKHAGLRGFVGDYVKIDVQAPPVDGRANEELIEMIASLAGVQASCVSILLGKTGARKTIEVDGISQRDLIARLQ